MLVEGLFVPLTTPFDRAGKVYLAKLAANVRRYSLAPVAGLVALTTPAGEGDALTDGEAQSVLEAVGSAASAEKVLIADCTRGGVSATLTLIHAAEQAGFDVALLGESACVGLTDAERLLFFQSVADASPLPILLCSDAARPLVAATVSALAAHENVLGILVQGADAGRLRRLRDEVGSAPRTVSVTSVFAAVTRRMAARDRTTTLVSPGALVAGTGLAGAGGAALKTRSKSVDFAILSGGRACEMLTTLEAGAAGVAPMLAACAPQACFEVYAAHKDGDPALAAMKQQRLAEADGLLLQSGVTGVKHACDRNGYFGGEPRLPRLGLVATERERLDQAFGKIPS